MSTSNQSTSRLLIRFIAGGVLLSMITVFLLHYFGTWESRDERPDAETTSSVVVYNKCAVLDDTHLLRPATGSSTNNNDVKFAGSFMNFFDGHIFIMIILALVIAFIMFGIKKVMSR